MLRQTLVIVLLGLVIGGATVAADERSDAQAQVDFGIDVARRGLWREAIYRWERAIDLDPTYASAWNNLAIGFEHEGRLDEAREAYETALDLDPENLDIEQNYDLFLEVNDRANQSSR
ncbi:MAG: tetratricopeptide repeat protein [Acidobacteriota bacterium]|nr:tetratricopeptide repeat protein [Acidobacteriota bacterium]